MSTKKNVLLIALIVSLGFSTAGEAGWVHFTSSMNTPAKNLKHTATHSQTLVVPVDVPGKSEICVFYSNTTGGKNKGRVLSTATTMDPDGETVVLNFVGGVSRNSYSNCKTGPALDAGSVVMFDHEFKGMPRVLGKKGQYFEVAGAVSDLGEPDFDRLLLKSSDGDSGWIHSASSLFVATEDTQKHPKKLAQTLLVANDLSDPQICVNYFSNLSQGKAGRIITGVGVERADGREQLKLAGGVAKNLYSACKSVGDVAAGEMVEFDLDLRNFPRVKMTDGKTEFFDVKTTISGAGEVEFNFPDVATPDTPDTTGDTPPPPTGTGGLSAADQICISKLLYAAGSGSRQIVRPRGNKGGKFEVFGPRSVFANGVVVTSTLGFGPTYAAACADYERKRGPIGPNGPALTSRDIANWIWYSNMNSAAGPTAVRRDPRGGFHADYFRPGLGAVIVNVSSPSAAIEALRRAGL